MSKLGIVGLGRVGSQVLTDVQYLNLFSEIVLIDSKEEIASGEALDHNHSQGCLIQVMCELKLAHIKI